MSWWPDERSFAGAEHLDPAYVAGYDGKAQFDPTADVAALRRYGLGPDSVVVDMGAGTGTFSLAVAALGASVVAVDPSPVMVRTLRQRALDEGATGLTVVEAGFLTYRHGGSPPDFVFSRNALHQLPDLWKAVALHRLAAMLHPGAIVMLHDLVYAMEAADFDGTVERWMANAATDPARGYTAADLATHVREEFSTFDWVLQGMLERTGFDILEHGSRKGVYGTYTCRRR